MTTKEFYTLAAVAGNKGELLEEMKNLPKPYAVNGIVIPENLNGIKLSELIMLSESKDDKALIENIAEHLLHVKSDTLYDTKAESVIGLMAWVTRELERISGMFAKIRLKPTAEELEAGAGKLDFGWFGTIDYFAKRMGITHDAAEETKWIIVFKCMEIDNKNAAYERRLHKVYEQKSKRG